MYKYTYIHVCTNIYIYIKRTYIQQTAQQSRNQYVDMVMLRFYFVVCFGGHIDIVAINDGNEYDIRFDLFHPMDIFHMLSLGYVPLLTNMLLLKISQHYVTYCKHTQYLQ